MDQSQPTKSDKYHPMVENICCDCKEVYQVPKNIGPRSKRCPKCNNVYKLGYNKNRRIKKQEQEARHEGLGYEPPPPFRGLPTNARAPVEVHTVTKGLTILGIKRARFGAPPLVRKGKYFKIRLILPAPNNGEKNRHDFVCLVDSMNDSGDQKTLIMPDWYFDWSKPDFETTTPPEFYSKPGRKPGAKNSPKGAKSRPKGAKKQESPNVQPTYL